MTIPKKKDTYGPGSVPGNMLIIRPTTASTSQTNPRENGNFGVKKIPEWRAACRLCYQPISGDAINICECDYPLLDLRCGENWSPELAKCGTCKKEYRKIYVTVEPEQIPEERQNRSWFSALKREGSCFIHHLSIARIKICTSSTLAFQLCKFSPRGLMWTILLEKEPLAMDVICFHFSVVFC